VGYHQLPRGISSHLRTLSLAPLPPLRVGKHLEGRRRHGAGPVDGAREDGGVGGVLRVHGGDGGDETPGAVEALQRYAAQRTPAWNKVLAEDNLAIYRPTQANMADPKPALGNRAPAGTPKQTFPGQPWVRVETSASAACCSCG
jgi:hypothetical protein